VPSVSCITTGADNAGADHDNPAAAVGEACCGEMLGVAVDFGVVLGCCCDDVGLGESVARDVGFAVLAGLSCFFQ